MREMLSLREIVVEAVNSYGGNGAHIAEQIDAAVDALLDRAYDKGNEDGFDDPWTFERLGDVPVGADWGQGYADIDRPISIREYVTEAIDGSLRAGTGDKVVQAIDDEVKEMVKAAYAEGVEQYVDPFEERYADKEGWGVRVLDVENLLEAIVKDESADETGAFDAGTEPSDEGRTATPGDASGLSLREIVTEAVSARFPGMGESVAKAIDDVVNGTEWGEATFQPRPDVADSRIDGGADSEQKTPDGRSQEVDAKMLQSIGAFVDDLKESAEPPSDGYARDEVSKDEPDGFDAFCDVCEQEELESLSWEPDEGGDVGEGVD